MPPKSPRELAELADEALLARRLRRLGLVGVAGVEVHQNRTVLVSVTARHVLRLHQGYAYASDRVLRAVVAFVHPATRRVERRRAESVVTAFPVEQFVPSRPNGNNGRRSRPQDRRIVLRLAALHRRFNRELFGGTLGRVRFRVSDRMRTRLGELTVDARTGRPVEIAVSREHVERDGWEEVCHTLLHEMVHQWQAETGGRMDHGPAFRAKAREVGVSPRARRDVRPSRCAAHRLSREDQRWHSRASTSST